HIPELQAMGVIRSADDLYRPCLNVQTGAWGLAKHFQVCGITWNCLGSYNAGFRADRHETREHYANRIWRIYNRLPAIASTATKVAGKGGK
ncbi:lytic transglycosylase domain-containing protein, partial [Salmonella enterica subsp. enterica serovar Dahomey]|nr:lytic transglycosylase domain-containing protein [Salmonella enterica subsp. enterica serovar Dahomey]